ncbi:protein kinase C-binding protein 1-like isoform X2 [Megalops cyprinoides]|uniref:protein kinase C-binding protein 1-like isoform X2 n=1 Tax=Megalops cyprinoides TaxID=118141 RepID=UPI0018643851|nr:protein kinase C-binding protein 1-like isoform X2 [Megalops cyprinoides]XP_036388506.1 protein kinase C-binding protein 1-like isoform X2 [Megalops cyprinoides]
MHPQSLAEEEIKTESDVVEGMDISTRSKVTDPGSAERAAQKRKLPSPPHSSNGHSPSETSPSPIKKKKKPGLLNSNNKEQSELRHGPFYYMKLPLTTDPVDVVPQDGRNDFYCWVCHREGQVLCCELCPRVYHAKCLKLAAEPEGDWFCPECEKITVAECIETQSKAMTMLTIDQLSYLLKFALQKMKQPGDQARSSLSPHAAAQQRKPINWTEPFQKPVSLEQHPDYAEYIFHPMDLCTLEKNIKKKMYGCTEAFLADMKWILHNCIIYNGGNHKLTATAKVIVKICEHEMNEIEVCPECYLSACQKRENWFCEPCSQPHPLVWAKLKGFPFWPAKALRDKDGQVDARFFGQHDRAWVPINNCYLMSKEIPFSVKKTKSIFNSAMQEMEIYVENIRKKFGVFNYAPFRTPYTPNNQFQMLLDPSNPSAGTVKPERQEKIKFNFDMTASPKMLLGKSMLPGGTSRRISLTEMPRSPMSTNSSVHTGSDIEQDISEKSIKALPSHYSAGEESMDCTASPASVKMGHTGSATGSPKTFSPQASTPIVPKQERTSTTGSILNLNLDRSKAEMDLNELSETVQQQAAPVVLTSPKRQIRSRFQLNLDKTIESCKAQLGIDEISEDVYKGVEPSDSEDSEKSDSSDSEYISEDEQKPRNGQNEADDKDKPERDLKKKPRAPSQGEDKDKGAEGVAVAKAEKTTTESLSKDKPSVDSDKEPPEKPKSSQHPAKEKPKPKDEGKTSSVDLDMDSDSERELVIDLREESGWERKKTKKEPATATTLKDPTVTKLEGKAPSSSSAAGPPASEASSSAPSVKDPAQSSVTIPLNVVSFAATTTSTLLPTVATSTASSVAASSSSVKKQRPLLPRETAPAVQRAVVWNPTNKFQTSSQKWHMQKVQRQQQSQQQPTAQTQHSPQQPTAQTQLQSTSSMQQPSPSTRYQTRQAVKAVQQKEVPQSTSSTVTLVTGTPAVPMISAPGTAGAPSSSTVTGDFQIATASADVAADIAKYTNKIMDAIKGTMTEIYNDLSKSTSGNTIAEIRRLRIEIEKLQWLHQQELSEMKHNLELTMAEMRQSLEQERERLIAEVKKQMEMEKQQAVDETKKKQWCANCKKEAIFYCCWNTSYCDYPCQQAHWPEHMKSCTQSATASQQETETEVTADTGGKSSGQSASGQPSPTEPGAALADKDANMEKSKDGVNVSVS